MLDQETLSRLRRLEIGTRRQIADGLGGQYHSVFKGRGMSFSEVRAYQPGDDVRTIDWNVTARAGEPFVKVFTEERELTVLLLVDVSASESFGSGTRSKAEVATELCAQVALSAAANGDRVGLILFSGAVSKVVPPRKGRSHAMRLLSDVMASAPIGQGTDLTAPLRALAELQRKPAVVFLVSDFLAEGYEAQLRVAAKTHDLVPVVVRDPVEARLPSGGLIALEDPESGERLLLDAGSEAVRQAVADVAREERAAREACFRRCGVEPLELSAGLDNTHALVKFFRARERRQTR